MPRINYPKSYRRSADEAGGEGSLVLWFAAALAAQAVGGILSSYGGILGLLGLILVIVATPIFVIACFKYAQKKRYKAYSPFLACLGFLPLGAIGHWALLPLGVGLIILLFLPDRN